MLPSWLAYLENVSSSLRTFTPTTADLFAGHDADGKGALGKIPSLFRNLVEGGEESILATRKVVALAVGED